ncbi:MAG: hypothetical protein AEth_01441 [Candidatus Argoarchaeum ethanivorans]|uniref:ACT domain-containing protein n=1 Tax=Candidatus Argoarchaeum ethanivorans TaxID=2608793 RepID=A0A8B3S2G1_9EURY|nr:MAG: hypothetical protein AEth_01441 [Candidatus Argoarchaeum ethanivorans]
MKTYFIGKLEKNKISGVPQHVIDTLGLGDKAQLYFDYYKYREETAEADIHEIIISPFDIATRQRLYYLNVKLGNIPKAMAKAVRVLSRNNFDIKSGRATDSLAGTTGEMEVIVDTTSFWQWYAKLSELEKSNLPYCKNLKEGELPVSYFDQLYKVAYNENKDDFRKYVKPQPSLDINTERSGDKVEKDQEFFPEFYEEKDQEEFIGLFSTAKRLLTSEEHFKRFANWRVSGGEATLQKRDAGDFDIQLEVMGGANIYSKIKEWFGITETEENEVTFYCPITADSEKVQLSISFLDPKETLYKLYFILKDEPGVLDGIVHHFGEKNINFRLVKSSVSTI